MGSRLTTNGGLTTVMCIDGFAMYITTNISSTYTTFPQFVIHDAETVDISCITNDSNNTDFYITFALSEGS